MSLLRRSIVNHSVMVDQGGGNKKYMQISCNIFMFYIINCKFYCEYALYKSQLLLFESFNGCRTTIQSQGNFAGEHILHEHHGFDKLFRKSQRLRIVKYGLGSLPCGKCQAESCGGSVSSVANSIVTYRRQDWNTYFSNIQVYTYSSRKSMSEQHYGRGKQLFFFAYNCVEKHDLRVRNNKITLQILNLSCSFHSV